jgi:hypothetical protein
MPKLNQILAIEKQTKASATEQLTAVYHQLQKEALLSGVSRTYKAKDEDGERFPSESQAVQLNVARLLEGVTKALTPLFNVTAQRDVANRSAIADVVVDDVVLMKDVPATHLLWLEKQFVDLHSLILKLPALPQTETWEYDAGQSCWRTDVTETAKTKKIPKPFIKAPATVEHPAQVDVVFEDVIQGYWSTVKFSGALPKDRIQTLRERIEKLLAAVKFAREAANLVETQKQDTASAVFGYLFA